MSFQYENNRQRSNPASHTIKKNDIEVIIKKSPLKKHEGGFDPKVAEFIKKQGDPNLRRPMEIEDIAAIRRRKEKHNKDLSNGVKEENKTIYLSDHELSIKIYNRSEQLKPGIVFYHGGGFFEQDTLVMKNICKFIAQEADAVVVAVEYGLAPEYPYQEGIQDCLEGLRYTYDFAEELGINAAQIGLVGDSVGGNLALGVHELSEKESWNIAYIGLLCPLVDLSELSRNRWNIEQYDLRKDEEMIREELITMKESLYFIQTLYLNDLNDVMRPLVSPLLRERKRGIPPVTMITAEFDFLRMQAEEFSQQLNHEDVPVRHFQYEGMEHAFVRKLGYYPQAEDAIKEITAHFKEVVFS